MHQAREELREIREERLRGETETEKNYGEALDAFGNTPGDVAALFDARKLNDPDPALKCLRHLLLRKMRDLVGEIADFPAIKG